MGWIRVDISAQLRAIANAEDGNTVLNNIGSAAEELNEVYDTDIMPELATIYNGMYGMYGRDIRQAIYDALFKLSISSPGGSGVGVVFGAPLVYSTGTVLSVNETIYGTAEEAE